MANAGLRAFSSVLEGAPGFQQNVAGAVNRQQDQKRKQTKFQMEMDAYNSGVEAMKSNTNIMNEIESDLKRDYNMDKNTLMKYRLDKSLYENTPEGRVKYGRQVANFLEQTGQVSKIKNDNPELEIEVQPSMNRDQFGKYIKGVTGEQSLKKATTIAGGLTQQGFSPENKHEVSAGEYDRLASGREATKQDFSRGITDAGLAGQLSKQQRSDLESGFQDAPKPMSPFQKASLRIKESDARDDKRRRKDLDESRVDSSIDEYKIYVKDVAKVEKDMATSLATDDQTDKGPFELKINKIKEKMLKLQQRIIIQENKLVERGVWTDANRILSDSLKEKQDQVQDMLRKKEGTDTLAGGMIGLPVSNIGNDFSVPSIADSQRLDPNKSQNIDKGQIDTPPLLTNSDKEAIQWLEANPNDPMAAEVRARLISQKKIKE